MNNQSHWSTKTANARLNKTRERIEHGAPEIQSVFTTLFPKESSHESSTLKTPLAGALVSVKDLFDVKGLVTKAGTTFMKDDKAATLDAQPIKQLREAGAVLVGHTNMTELAFSGLGINPHYGTPANALYPDRVPGGSSSGGAVSVSLGLADIAIGTDTGGSLRIPAAFNGIVGYKPTQSTVSRVGCKPLSYSLDSVGPMAKKVKSCRLAFNAMRLPIACDKPLVNPNFVVPTNFGTEDLDSEVKAAFESALQRLSEGGYTIEHRIVPILDVIKNTPIWHYACVEARGVYEELINQHGQQIDPRVLSRIMRSDEVSAWAYSQSLKIREKIIADYEHQEANSVLLMPTCPTLPPRLEKLTEDDSYYSTNMQVLRNPSAANVLNACSISIPHKEAESTIGIMLTAPAYHDDALLSIAQYCEKLLA